MDPQTLSLGAYQDSFVRSLRVWREENRVRRLWEKDPSLWTGKDEARWLGWLDVVGRERSRVEELEAGLLATRTALRSGLRELRKAVAEVTASFVALAAQPEPRPKLPSALLPGGKQRRRRRRRKRPRGRPRGGQVAPRPRPRDAWDEAEEVGVRRIRFIGDD